MPYESVIAGYQPWQFLHGMAAVATPKVESPDSQLANTAVILQNIWWAGNEGVPSLVDLFPTIGWTGEAADAAFSFLLRLQTVTGQVNMLVKELYGIVPKYAVIIKGVRDSLDEAAAGLVKAFEEKFGSKPESGLSVDVAGAVFAGIAAGLVAFVSGGAPVLASGATTLWSALFADVAGDLLKTAENSVGGYWWRDLVESYMHQQAQILTEATDEIDQLNRTITGLMALFNHDKEILAFLRDYGS